MTSNQLDELLMHRLRAAGINASSIQARILRRAQLTLHRWAEEECGTSNQYGSYSLERDEATGQPYRCFYPHNPATPKRRHLIADKEKSALRRVKDICDDLGCHFYHQPDPRGCALYLSSEPLTPSNYTNGVACAL